MGGRGRHQAHRRHLDNLSLAAARRRMELADGQWRATEQGLADLGGEVAPMPAPGMELVEFWVSRISGVGPMLRLLAERFPDFVARDELAAASAWRRAAAPSGPLSRLRGAGLLDEAKGGSACAPRRP